MHGPSEFDRGLKWTSSIFVTLARTIKLPPLQYVEDRFSVFVPTVLHSDGSSYSYC